MSWFPHFLSPFSAILAAAHCHPRAAGALFPEASPAGDGCGFDVPVEEGDSGFQVNAPFQKLRRNLLLLLQLLLLLLLCLALSRPVSNYTPGAGKTSVILIDRSASMAAKDVNGHSRLDEAKRRAKDLIASMDRNASATVIAFDDQAETIQAFTTDARRCGRPSIRFSRPIGRAGSSWRISWRRRRSHSFPSSFVPAGRSCRMCGFIPMGVSPMPRM